MRLKSPVFGYIGRLLECKGLDVFLRAIVLYKEEFGKEFSILILGRGEYRENVEKVAKNFGLITNLILIDAVPHQMVVDYMGCLDIFVLPSKTMPKWKEQFGRVLIEANGVCSARDRIIFWGHTGGNRRCWSNL